LALATLVIRINNGFEESLSMGLLGLESYVWIPKKYDGINLVKNKRKRCPQDVAAASLIL
jgi:hypothetical protein